MNRQEDPSFTDRRASRDPSVDHSSHSMQWVGGKCPECPDDIDAPAVAHHQEGKVR